MQQAVCVRNKKKHEKKHEKIRPTQNTPRNPQQPGDRVQLQTACKETRPTHSPASIDPGFAEIGLVQLSQSVKTTNVTHTLTDTQTD